MRFVERVVERVSASARLHLRLCWVRAPGGIGYVENQATTAAENTSESAPSKMIQNRRVVRARIPSLTVGVQC